MSTRNSIDTLELPNGVRNIKSRACAGVGVPAIFAEAITTVQTGAVTTIVSFTPPSNPGRYKVGGNIALTSGTNTGTVSLVVNYTDVNGTSHVQDILPLAKADGTIVASGTGASTDWKACDVEITVDSSATAISLDTTISGSVHYLVSAYIMQVA